MTTSSDKGNDGELLLVAVVEMAPGNAAAGQEYEDAVLGLLSRHGGLVERRTRSLDSATEVHIIRFRSRAGYESFMVDPDRLGYRDKLGDAAPTTRVLEVYDLPDPALNVAIRAPERLQVAERDGIGVRPWSSDPDRSWVSPPRRSGNGRSGTDPAWGQMGA
jgi:hypothetical protein